MKIIIEPLDGNKKFSKDSLDYLMFYDSLGIEKNFDEQRSLGETIQSALDWGESEIEHNSLKITIKES